MKIITQKVWMVENYHYLCSVLSLLTASKDTKKGRDLQILDKRIWKGIFSTKLVMRWKSHTNLTHPGKVF